MTLPSSSIGTPVKCCVSVRECSAGRTCSTLEYSPMARWSSSPGGIGLGRYFVIPSTSGASCGRQTSPKAGMARVQRSVPEFAHLPTAQGHRAKIILKKDSLTILGRYLRRRLPCRSWRKNWGLPALSCKMEHGKAPLQAERVPIPRHLLCGTSLTPGLVR